MKIPSGVTITVEGNHLIVVKGPKGEVKREFVPNDVEITLTADSIESKPKSKSPKRRHMAMANAIAAHIKNMIEGVTTGYEKKLVVVFAHFPVTITEKDGIISVKNFFGEKNPRSAKVVGKATKVKIDKQDIVISGADKEAVGQTAANLIKATQVTKRDRRVFQDGVYPAA